MISAQGTRESNARNQSKKYKWVFHFNIGVANTFSTGFFWTSHKSSSFLSQSLCSRMFFITSLCCLQVLVQVSPSLRLSLFNLSKIVSPSLFNFPNTLLSATYHYSQLTLSLFIVCLPKW